MLDTQNNLLTQYLPLSAVGAIVVAVVGGIMWISTVATKGEVTSANVIDIQETIKDYPNRREFETLQGSVNRIETSINQVNDYLLKKK